MTAGNRPLSPHLQIYRPQITSQVYASGWAVLIAATLLTVLAWGVLLLGGGS